MATKPVAWLVIDGGCVVEEVRSMTGGMARGTAIDDVEVAGGFGEGATRGVEEEVEGTTGGTGVGATGGSAGGVREDEATDGGFREVGGAMTTEGAGGEMVETTAGEVDEEDAVG